MQTASTDYGYTGQFHLDDTGLIHINGRVYDPRLGRFISADPYIQSPDDLQSYNRYSYVMNNPFFYTDPSGFEGEDSGGGFWDGFFSFFDNMFGNMGGMPDGGGGSSPNMRPGSNPNDRVRLA